MWCHPEQLCLSSAHSSFFFCLRLSTASCWKKSGKLRSCDGSPPGDVVRREHTSSVPRRRDAGRPSNRRRHQREAGAKVAGQSARSYRQHAALQRRGSSSPAAASTSSSSTETRPELRGGLRRPAAASALDAAVRRRRRAVLVRRRSSLPRRRRNFSDFRTAVGPSSAPGRPLRSQFSRQRRRLHRGNSSSSVWCSRQICLHWPWSAIICHASTPSSSSAFRIYCYSSGSREFHIGSPDGACAAQRLQPVQLRLMFHAMKPTNSVELDTSFYTNSH